MDEFLLSKEELEILDGRYECKIECLEDLYWFNRFFRNYLVVNVNFAMIGFSLGYNCFWLEKTLGKLCLAEEWHLAHIRKLQDW